MKRKSYLFFPGAGGMDLGIIKSCFEIVWANDFEKDAISTYSKNIGDHIILGDITQIKSDDILVDKNEVDLIIVVSMSRIFNCK